MRLFLLRSAEAANGKKDAKRKLNSNGIESLSKLVDCLSKKDLNEIAEVRHSPFIRAAQTAKQFKKMAGIKAKVREVPLLEPLADFRILADFIESSNETLLLVGHQPNLGRLGTYLLSRESDVTLLDLKPGGLACLTSNGPKVDGGAAGNHWQLNWQIKPRMLRKI